VKKPRGVGPIGPCVGAEVCIPGQTCMERVVFPLRSGNSPLSCNPLVPDSSSTLDAQSSCWSPARTSVFYQHLPLFFGLIEIQPHQQKANLQTQMPGMCDKAQSKFRPVSKTFVMGSEAFQNSYCASREASLCFEPSLSLEEVYLKPPREKPCDSTNFLLPARCEFTLTTL
jgi:hypothetical protein